LSKTEEDSDWKVTTSLGMARWAMLLLVLMLNSIDTGAAADDAVTIG